MPAVEAMIVLIRELAEAGCLTEPAPPPPALTLDGAARLLCELSRSVRLSDPDEDYRQLLEGSSSMVDYAWGQAVVAGIPPAQMSDAQEARRLLLAHHRAQS